MPLEMEQLTEQEAQALWHVNTRRAADFDWFVTQVTGYELGQSFRVRIPGGKLSKGPVEKNAEEARKVRYNFNEAAKERTAVRVLSEIPDGTPDDAQTITVDDIKYTRAGDAFKATVPAPVVLRWKAESHTEQHEVTKDGKKAKVDVTVIDALTLLVVSTEAIRRRGPRHTADAARNDGSTSSASATPNSETPAETPAIA